MKKSNECKNNDGKKESKMYLANNGLFDSPWICIGPDCKEIAHPLLWANEETKSMCVYKMKNNSVIRNEWGYPETEILKNVDFKIISRETFMETNIKNKIVDGIKNKQGVK